MCAGQKGRYKCPSFLTLSVKFSIFSKTIIKESAVFFSLKRSKNFLPRIERLFIIYVSILSF